jgi:hypothetical protein
MSGTETIGICIQISIPDRVSACTPGRMRGFHYSLDIYFTSSSPTHTPSTYTCTEGHVAEEVTSYWDQDDIGFGFGVQELHQNRVWSNVKWSISMFLTYSVASDVYLQ